MGRWTLIASVDAEDEFDARSALTQLVPFYMMNPDTTPFRGYEEQGFTYALRDDTVHVRATGEVARERDLARAIHVLLVGGRRERWHRLLRRFGFRSRTFWHTFTVHYW